MPFTVQCYFLTPATDVPNNNLPVLHYQNVLPQPLTEQTATTFLTSHDWEKRVCFTNLSWLITLPSYLSDSDKGHVGTYRYPALPSEQS